MTYHPGWHWVPETQWPKAFAETENAWYDDALPGDEADGARLAQQAEWAYWYARLHHFAVCARYPRLAAIVRHINERAIFTPTERRICQRWQTLIDCPLVIRKVSLS